MSTTTHVSGSFLAGDLTTIFTPDASCLGSDQRPYTWTAQTQISGTLYCSVDVLQMTDCYPENAFLGNFVPTNAYYYSPGVCPHAFDMFTHSPTGTSTLSASATAGTQEQDTVITVPSRSGVGAFCCPMGMVFNRQSNTCQSAVRTPTDIMIEGKVQSVAQAFVAQLPAISISWETSDLPKFIPPSAPLSNSFLAITGVSVSSDPVLYVFVSSSLSSVTSLVTAVPLSTTVIYPASKQSSLQPSTVIGIGIGAALGALLVFVALSAVFWRHRRRRSRKSRYKESDDEGLVKAELPGHSKPRAELDPERQLAEMAARNNASESDACSRYELEGDYRGSELPAVLHSDFGESSKHD